jgi:predicted aldo/keto reductase-like oxidoreductase
MRECEVDPHACDRRGFLQAGALATASVLSAGSTGHAHNQDPPADASKKKSLPTRRLGKTGVDVTLLTQGTWRSESLDRILRFAYASGIRYFDTAKSYGSEPGFKRWFQQTPEVRKDIFLVTKDSPRVPADMPKMLDQRLETLGTDYVDLFFVHALGDHHSADVAVNWPKSKEFRAVVDKIKKSGKAKFVGFSTHHANRAAIIEAAAEGGCTDVIMLQYTPWLDKESPLNRAIDAAWKANIGLVSMKQVAGQFQGNPVLKETAERMPMLKERGLSVFQGLLHAIWSDERIATSCVSMRNLDQVRENADAARRFEPLKKAEIEQLRDACIAHGPTLCADCDGRCSRAAGTNAALGDLTRLLTYHEHHGLRAEARRQYAELTDDRRDWSGADLVAAREACPNKLNFAQLLPRVDRHLA